MPKGWIASFWRHYFFLVSFLCGVFELILLDKNMCEQYVHAWPHITGGLQNITTPLICLSPWCFILLWCHIFKTLSLQAMHIFLCLRWIINTPEIFTSFIKPTVFQMMFMLYEQSRVTAEALITFILLMICLPTVSVCLCPALRDNRIELVRASWSELTISISDVTLSDEGMYTCSLFTMPVRTAKAYLTVLGKSTYITSVCLLNRSCPDKFCSRHVFGASHNNG